jgi:hypothetical protein
MSPPNFPSAQRRNYHLMDYYSDESKFILYLQGDTCRSQDCLSKAPCQRQGYLSKLSNTCHTRHHFCHSYHYLCHSHQKYHHHQHNASSVSTPSQLCPSSRRIGMRIIEFSLIPVRKCLIDLGIASCLEIAWIASKSSCLFPGVTRTCSNAKSFLFRRV